MARLGDVASYMNGYAFKPSDWSDTGLPIIRIQDLTGNSYQANRYNGEYALKYEVNQGDVLISWSASLGVYVWQGEKALLNQHIFKVIFDKTEISKSFFVHQVENILEKASSEAHGATMKHLTKPVFDALPFYLPPLDEQRKIAAVLDKVSDLIAKRRQQLDKLDELIKARFVEMFGDPIINNMSWPKALIGDNCFVTKLAGFEYTQYIHYEDSGDVVMVKAQNVKKGKLNDKDISFISNEVSDSLPRSQLAPGDVVMTYVGANIGDVALIDEKHKYHLAPNVAKIRPNSKVYDSTYFMYMLMFLNSYIMENSADTAKAALGMERIRKLVVCIPPIDLQRYFSDFVKKIDKSKSVVQKSLEQLETLKKALMQEYFG